MQTISRVTQPGCVTMRHFVCLSGDRPANGYGTAEIGGAAITVENTRVGLAAFRNVCSHRPHSSVRVV